MPRFLSEERELALSAFVPYRKIGKTMACCAAQCFIALAATLPFAAFGAGTPTLAGNKLIGVKHEFKIFAANNNELAEAAETMLEAQRASLAKYQRAATLSAASKYDHELLRTYLRSQGYYAAKIDSQMVKEEILHQIYPGPRYTIAQFSFDWPSNVPLPPEEVQGIKAGDPLVAETVLQAVSNIKNWVIETQCLRRIDVSYEAVVLHPKRAANVQVRLEASPQVIFGPVRYSGHNRIEDRYLDNYLGFAEGDCFKPRLVDSTRLKLLQTNLLAAADPELGDITDDGKVPVHYHLTERKQRSILAAIGYDADVHMKYTTGWEHRNLMGRGEQFNTELTYSDIAQSLDGELIFPYFRNLNQRLTLTGRIAQETPDAYEVLKGEAGASIKRELNNRLAATVGTNIAFSRVEEFESEEDFALLSFPVSLDYSRRNDPLNPTQGWVSGFQVEPFIDLYETERRFTQTTFAISAYYTHEDWKIKPTLALRMANGVINGAELEEIPADERFYVGGGGSVRGYRYQSIGEKDANGEPAGGLAFSEVSFEIRTRITRSIGITLFADGGYAYPTKTARIGDDYLWGAGIGLRYHTAFAPFRIDIATPLDKREGDDSVQLYIAIGQAF